MRRRHLTRAVLVLTATFGSLTSGIVGAGRSVSQPDGARPPDVSVTKTTIGPDPTVPPPPTGPGSTVGPPATLASPITVASPTLPPLTAPPTSIDDSTLPPESIAAALALFGLDGAQLQCISASDPFVMDDISVLAVLQGCGVALMPIVQGIIAVNQLGDAMLDPSASTIPMTTVAGTPTLPPADALFIQFMLLTPPEAVACLAAGVASTPTGDDATALAVMQRCAVPLGLTVSMLTVALDGGGAVGPVTTTTLGSSPATAVVTTSPPVPVVTSGPAVPTTVGIDPDSPFVDQFLEMLLDTEGITLTDEQAACLLNAGAAAGDDFDPENLGAVVEILEACDISLTDLVPDG